MYIQLSLNIDTNTEALTTIMCYTKNKNIKMLKVEISWTESWTAISTCFIFVSIKKIGFPNI